MYNEIIFKEELFEYMKLLTERIGTGSDAAPTTANTLIAMDCNQKNHHASNNDNNHGDNTKIEDSIVGSLPSSTSSSSLLHGAPFDIVDEYNRAVELWYHGTRPNSIRLAAMINMIGDFMAWFSDKMMRHAKSNHVPTTIASSTSSSSSLLPFMRTPLPFDKMKNIGIHLEQLLSCCPSSHYQKNSNVVIGDAGDGGAYLVSGESHVDASPMAVTTPATSFLSNAMATAVTQLQKRGYSSMTPYYYFDRWLWIQFPWLALKNAPNYCRRMKQQEQEQSDRSKINDETAKTAKSLAKETSTTNISGNLVLEATIKAVGDRKYWDVKKEDPTISPSFKSSNVRDAAMARSEIGKKSATQLKVESQIHQGSCTTSVTSTNAAALSKDDIDGDPFSHAKKRHESFHNIDDDKANKDSCIDPWQESKSMQNYPPGCSFLLLPNNTSSDKELATIASSQQTIQSQKELYDKLKVEHQSKQHKLKQLLQAYDERSQGDRMTKQRIDDGETQISQLEQRLSKTFQTNRDATLLGDFLRLIEHHLQNTKPSGERKHLDSLEQQVTLARQQYRDLATRKKKVSGEIDEMIAVDLASLKRELKKWEERKDRVSETLGEVRGAAAATAAHERRDCGNEASLAQRRSSSTFLAISAISHMTSAKSLLSSFTGNRMSNFSMMDHHRGQEQEQEKDRKSNHATAGIASAMAVGNPHDNTLNSSCSTSLCCTVESIKDICGSVDPDKFLQLIRDADRLYHNLKEQKHHRDKQIAQLQRKLKHLNDEWNELKLTGTGADTNIDNINTLSKIATTTTTTGNDYAGATTCRTGDDDSSPTNANEVRMMDAASNAAEIKLSQNVKKYHHVTKIIQQVRTGVQHVNGMASRVRHRVPPPPTPSLHHHHKSSSASVSRRGSNTIASSNNKYAKNRQNDDDDDDDSASDEDDDSLPQKTTSHDEVDNDLRGLQRTEETLVKIIESNAIHFNRQMGGRNVDASTVGKKQGQIAEAAFRERLRTISAQVTGNAGRSTSTKSLQLTTAGGGAATTGGAGIGGVAGGSGVDLGQHQKTTTTATAGAVVVSSGGTERRRCNSNTAWMHGGTDVTSASSAVGEIRIVTVEQMDRALEDTKDDVTSDNNREDDDDDNRQSSRRTPTPPLGGIITEGQLFVSEALSTNGSRNEQRRANILADLKQNGRADRGLIVETILSRNAAGVGGDGAENDGRRCQKLKTTTGAFFDEDDCGVTTATATTSTLSTKKKKYRERGALKKESRKIVVMGMKKKDSAADDSTTTTGRKRHVK